jgi:hypothetical protein
MTGLGIRICPWSWVKESCHEDITVVMKKAENLRAKVNKKEKLTLAFYRNLLMLPRKTPAPANY